MNEKEKEISEKISHDISGILSYIEETDTEGISKEFEKKLDNICVDLNDLFCMLM